MKKKKKKKKKRKEEKKRKGIFLEDSKGILIGFLLTSKNFFLISCNPEIVRDARRLWYQIFTNASMKLLSQKQIKNENFAFGKQEKRLCSNWESRILTKLLYLMKFGQPIVDILNCLRGSIVGCHSLLIMRFPKGLRVLESKREG